MPRSRRSAEVKVFLCGDAGISEAFEAISKDSAEFSRQKLSITKPGLVPSKISMLRIGAQ